MTSVDRVAAVSLVIGALVIAGCSSGSDPRSATATTATSLTVPFTTSSILSTSTSARPVPASSTTSPPGPSTSTASKVTGATTTVAPRVVSQPGDNVRLGDTGSGVKQIQSALVAHGYKVSPDGTFGPLTAQAVKDFQTKNGLAADGVVGPATWAKLSAATTGTTAASTTPKATTTTTKH